MESIPQEQNSIFFNSHLNHDSENKGIQIKILSKGGILLLESEDKGFSNVDADLESGFLTAISIFFKESFRKDLKEIKLDRGYIAFEQTKNFLCYLIAFGRGLIPKYKSSRLRKLLNQLEQSCPESNRNIFNLAKIHTLVTRFFNTEDRVSKLEG